MSARTSIEQDRAATVASHEVRRACHILDVRPAVRVHGRLRAGRDVRLEDSDQVVLEQLAMVLRRGSERVQRIRPRPGAVQVRHALTGAMPHAVVYARPGSSRTTASPERNAFGGHVIGSTAKLRRLTSGSGRRAHRSALSPRPRRQPSVLRELFGNDDSSRGLDECEMRESLREIAQVPPCVDVELLGVQAER